MFQNDSIERPGVSTPNFMSLLRILQGVILLWKSINFIVNTSAAESLIQQTGVGVFSDNARILAFVVSYLGLLCGIFIFIGLLTRYMAILQIPVLIVAVFFINLKNFGNSSFEFILSLVTLALLILFAIKGSVKFSADEYFRRGAAIDRRTRGRS